MMANAKALRCTCAWGVQRAVRHAETWSRVGKQEGPSGDRVKGGGFPPEPKESLLGLGEE